jgi:hypothetical protein
MGKVGVGLLLLSLLLLIIKSLLISHFDFQVFCFGALVFPDMGFWWHCYSHRENWCEI